MDLNNLFYSSSFIKELSSKSKESQVKNRSKGGIDNLYNSVFSYKNFLQLETIIK